MDSMIRGGVEQYRNVGETPSVFPVTQTYTPVLTSSTGSVSVPGSPAFIQGTLVDWGYKLDFSLCVGMFQLSTNATSIYASLPPGFSLIAAGSQFAKSLYQDTIGFYYELIGEVELTVGQELKLTNPVPFSSGKDSLMTLTGSVWLV